jgi:uracil permease
MLLNKFKWQECILASQHILAMFSSVILFSIITGLDISISLLTAGIGTLLFYYSSEKKVPIFLGSNSIYILVTLTIMKNEGIGAVKGGVMAVGIVYMVIAYFIKYLNEEKINRIFGPLVFGCLMFLVGILLAKDSIRMIGYTGNSFNLKHLSVAIVTITSFILFSRKDNFMRVIALFLSIFVGYVFCAVLGGIIDYTPLLEASWFGFSTKTISDLTALPIFSVNSILTMSLLGCISFLEHIANVKTNGKIVGKNFIKDPGISKTLCGDGLASFVSGILGGPVKIPYNENTVVLILTKNYDPNVLKLAAVFTIIISFIGKISAILITIPEPVIGGASIIIYGTSICLSIRVFVTDRINFESIRNIVIVSITVVTGIGINDIKITDNVSISGITIAILLCIFLNFILKENKKEDFLKEEG